MLVPTGRPICTKTVKQVGNITNTCFLGDLISTLKPSQLFNPNRVLFGYYGW